MLRKTMWDDGDNWFSQDGDMLPMRGCFGGGGGGGGGGGSAPPSYTYDAYGLDGNKLGQATFGAQLQENSIYDASPDGRKARYAFQGGRLNRQQGDYFGLKDFEGKQLSDTWVEQAPNKGVSYEFAVPGGTKGRFAFDGTGFSQVNPGSDWGSAAFTPSSQTVANVPTQQGAATGGAPVGVDGQAVAAQISPEGHVAAPTVSQPLIPDVSFHMPVLNKDGTTTYTPAHQLSSRLGRRAGWSGNIMEV